MRLKNLFVLILVFIQGQNHGGIEMNDFGFQFGCGNLVDYFSAG